MNPIGVVVGGRQEPLDDHWGDVEAEIHLDAVRFGPDVGARHPRGRSDWPAVGILAQRTKARPNRLGVTTCELVGVDGLVLRVRGLDAIAGTPVLDVKPYLAEFAPRGPTTQPAWATELMAGYWSTPG